MANQHDFDRRTFLRATGGAATAGLLAGCAGSPGGGGGGPIVFGALEPLSGPFAPWGKVHRDGLQFAVSELNADGGVLGRDVEAVVSDTKSDPGGADSEFRRFVEQEDVVAATGPVSSDVGIRTSRTAQELEVPLLLHMAGSDKVITKDTKHTFRVGLLPAATTTKAQASMVTDKGYSNVGAIIADYAWGQSVKSGIENNFGDGVNIQVAPVGAKDFKSYIRKMPDDLEMMVATGHPPGSLTITKQLYELGYEPEVITGPSFPPGVIVGALGKNADRGFTHIHQTDVYSDEFASVAKRFGEEKDAQFNTHTAYGYVTGKLLAAAIEEAGETTPTAIADAIRNIEFDTLFAEPIQYSKFGELKNQVQIYSQFKLEAPSYYSGGKYSYVEQFRTDPLPPLPAEA